MTIQSLDLNSFIIRSKEGAKALNKTSEPQKLNASTQVLEDKPDVIVLNNVPPQAPKKKSNPVFNILLGITGLAILNMALGRMKFANFPKPPTQGTRRISEVFEDISGAKRLDEMALPETLVETTKKIIAGIKNPDLIEARGGKKVGSILLYGPPGTGKTTYVKALAKMFPNSEFASVDVTKITSKWVGETEKNLQRAIDEICERADMFPDKKIFVFIDEIDSVMMVDRPDVKYSNDALNEFKRCFSERLAKRKNIITVGATNLDISDIDPTTGKKLDRAMLDRFEQKILVDLPTPAQIKKAIVNHYKNSSMVSDELKDLHGEKLGILAEFLGKREHKVSFRTLESIFTESASSIEDTTSKVSIGTIFETVRKKAKELNLSRSEIEDLARKLGIEYKESANDFSDSIFGARRRIGFV